MTWGQAAEVYQKLTGVKIRWEDEQAFLDYHPRVKEVDVAKWAWIYDRRYNRDIDSSKILRVTGLTQDDFVSVEEGLRRELDILAQSEQE